MPRIICGLRLLGCYRCLRSLLPLHVNPFIFRSEHCPVRPLVVRMFSIGPHSDAFKLLCICPVALCLHNFFVQMQLVFSHLLHRLESVITHRYF